MIKLNGGILFMNQYDAAHNLAKSIKNSQEYKDYQEAVKKIKSNNEAKKIFEDFRQKQLELQSAQMMGQKVPEEKLSDFKRMGETLQFHPVVTDFLNAEYRYSQMFSDIQKILSDSMDIWMPGMDTQQ